jgi:ribonuclease PH
VDKTLERRLEAVFRQAVLLEAHPRALTTITVQVCGDDGGLASTAVNACSLALMDAGVPLRFFPRACDVALLPNLPHASGAAEPAAAASSSGSSVAASVASANRMVLDPTALEAATALARCTFAFMPADAVTSSSSAGPGVLDASRSQARAVMMDVTGAVSAPALVELCGLAESGAAAAGEFLASAMTRRTQRDAEVRGLELLEAVAV